MVLLKSVLEIITLLIPYLAMPIGLLFALFVLALITVFYLIKSLSPNGKYPLKKQQVLNSESNSGIMAQSKNNHSATGNDIKQTTFQNKGKSPNPVDANISPQNNNLRNHSGQQIFVPVQLVFPPVVKKNMLNEQEMGFYDILLQILNGELNQFGKQFFIWPKVPLCNLVQIRAESNISFPPILSDVLGSCVTFVISWKETYEPVVAFIYIDNTTDFDEERGIKTAEVVKRANIFPVILRRTDINAYSTDYSNLRFILRDKLQEFMSKRSLFHSQSIE